MRAPTVLAISAVAHVALFAGLSQVALPDLAVRDQAPPPAHEPEPIEVIVLAAPSTPAPVATAAVAPTPKLRGEGKTSDSASSRPSAPVRSMLGLERGSRRTITPTVTDTASAAVASPSPSETGAPPSGLMHMRARDTGLDVTSEIAGRIPGRPYVAPSEPKVSGKLESTPGGGAVVNDTVTTMTVERDGNISFADKPDIDIKLKLPIPNLDPEQIRKDLGRTLTEWYADPYAATKFGAKSEVSRVWMAVPGACDSWGDVWCDDEMAPKAEKYVRDQKKTGGSLFGGTMDITAYLHRKFIGDPYSSRKLKLLDETRDERVARGAVFRTQQLVRSAELVERTLRQLWARETDPVKRRAALFELWDDCEEGAGEETGERGQAGQRARAMILGWIAAQLPAGSEGAYTDEDLRLLNARRSSKQPFAPYRAAPLPP